MPPKSIYREEVPNIINKIRKGIQELVETRGPNETVYVLEYILAKLSQHKGEFIRLPKIDPELLHKIDVAYIHDLLEPSEPQQGLFQVMVTDQGVKDRFTALVNEIDSEDAS